MAVAVEAGEGAFNRAIAFQARIAHLISRLPLLALLWSAGTFARAAPRSQCLRDGGVERDRLGRRIEREPFNRNLDLLVP